MAKKTKDIVKVTMPGVPPGTSAKLDKLLQELAEAIQAEIDKEEDEQGNKCLKKS